MSPFQVIRLVAMREIIVRARGRAYLLSTGFVVVLVVAAAIGLPLLEDFFESEDRRVGLVGQDAASIGESLEAVGTQLEIGVEAETYADASAAEAALDDGDVGALVVDGQSLIFAGSVDDELAAIVNEGLRQWRLPAQLEELGLSFEDAESILQPAPLPITLVDEDDENAAAGLAIAGLSAVLLFISIMTYGQWVLHGVIEEKSSRIVEVLLSTLQPYQLLAGKIFGILVLGIGQMVVLLVAGAAAVMVAGEADIPTVATLGVVSAVLGIVLYGVVFGVAGALVSRQEEASNVTMPITTVLMGGYFAAIFVVQNDPGGLPATLISLFPFTAPVSMPGRVALGEVAAWEFGLALVLMVGAIAGSIFAGGRIYAGAILRVGPRVALRDAWRPRR